MKAPGQSSEDKKVLATARQYKRNGYSIAMPRRGDPVPSFLDDFVPDLIAEREDDRVVVEIKRADRVTGSNDIVALAEKVALQPEWRFELISMPPEPLLEQASLETANDEVTRLIALGFTKAAFLVSYGMIENTLVYVAVSNKLKMVNVTVDKLARELVVNGLISDEDLKVIIGASQKRNQLVHGVDKNGPPREQVEALIVFAGRLRDEVREERAA